MSIILNSGIVLSNILKRDSTIFEKNREVLSYQQYVPYQKSSLLATFTSLSIYSDAALSVLVLVVEHSLDQQ